MVLLSVLVVALAVRSYAIGAKPVWLDEAFSIWLANQSLWAMWGWLIKIDQHPPLYYTLLHLWQWLFGDLQGVVRLFSALCSMATIPFFYGTARQLFDRPTALIATVILATAPFHIRYAQETRMYALLTLTVAVALYLLARILCHRPDTESRRLWHTFAIAQAAVMLTHNTAAVFFPVALNIAIGGALLLMYIRGGIPSLIGLTRPDFERRWLRAQGLALLCWLPWSPPFVLQSIGVDREFWIPFPTITVIYETLHNFHLAHQPFTPLPWLVGDLLYWCFALLGIVAIRRQGGHLLLLLALFFVPFGGELLVSLRRPIFSDRTLIWTTLPYYLLVAHGIQRSGQWVAQHIAWTKVKRIAPLLSGAFLFILVLFNGQALANYYQHFPKEEWDKAAAYVATQAKPGDLLLFNATWVQLPFDYYFRHFPAAQDERIARHGVPVDLFDRGILEPKMTRADLPRLETLVADHQRVWLIYSHDWYTDSEQQIPRALANKGRLVDEQRFIGLRILRYEVSP